MLNLNNYIKVINGYPKEGISFKDVTPILQSPEAFEYVVNELAQFAKAQNANVIVGPEARGFLFGAPVALQAKMSFVPVRKPHKLPREVVSYTYDLEYGSDTLCMHKDGIKKGENVVIIDDLIALGGTVNAAIHLINELGGEVVGIGCVIALENLPGIEELPKKYPFKALLKLSDKE